MDDGGSIPGTVDAEKFISNLETRSSLGTRTDSGELTVGLVDFTGIRKLVRSFGETARDQVLREAVSRLQSIGCAEFIGHVGQDKLALLKDNVGSELASSWAAAVRLALHPLYIISGQEVEVESHLARRSGPPVKGCNLLWLVERNMYVDRIRELQQQLDAIEPAFAGVVGVLGANESLRGEVQRFKYLATRDPLTSLLNRRGIAQRISELSSRFSLAFIDLDDLRELNRLDELWESGDLALQGVSHILREAFGDNDVARWGGDEFLVSAPGILPQVLADTLVTIKDLCQETLIVSGRPITFSAGVAGSDDGDWETAHDRAQKALRAAKVTKNAVVVSHD
jgi:diguanylate cyclase (GGDEF)-like protein